MGLSFRFAAGPWVVVLLLVACGDDATATDAGVSADASVAMDSAAADSSMPDAGSVDFILVRESGVGGYGQDSLSQARIVGANDCP